VWAHGRIDARHATYARLSASLNKAHNLVKAVNDDFDRYDRDAHDAAAAGQHRHDIAMHDGSDEAFTSAAKSEQKGVRLQQAEISAGIDAINELVDVYAAIYGSDATQRARDLVGRYGAARNQALNDWQRAIDDIIDDHDLHAQGRSTPDHDLEALYRQSDNEGSTADSESSLMSADLIRLRKRRESDVATAQRQTQTLF
jgi:hypothetical protein